MAGKNWQIEGRYVEYCSCDHGCPCETMANPTYGHCTGLVAFKIDNGWCEDVRLDDLAVAATAYTPRALHHGQGIMQPILDERATEAQREALFYILSGADQPVGTVFQIFAAGMGAIKFDLNGRHCSLAHIAWNQNGMVHSYDEYKQKFSRP